MIIMIGITRFICVVMDIYNSDELVRSNRTQVMEKKKKG